MMTTPQGGIHLPATAEEKAARAPGPGHSTGRTSVCERCGCTDDEACPGGCAWLRLGLCTACELLPTGAALIAAERRRQVEVEGYTPEHDAQHGPIVLHNAGTALVQGLPGAWPPAWAWKPKNKLRDLIRAGALYQAVVDLPGVDGWFHMRAESARDRVARLIDELLIEVRTLDRRAES